MGNILYIHWKIDPILFNIGEIRIAYYSLLFVGGLILCTWLFRKISLKEGASEEAINSLIMYTFLGITIPFVLLGLYYAFVYKRKVHSKVVGR